MSYFFKHLLCAFVSLCLITSLVQAATPSEIKTLYSRLQPQSLEEHLAFFELYPDSSEGKKALQTISDLLGTTDSIALTELPSLTSSLSALINRGANAPLPKLSETTLNALNTISQRLPNRKLLGFNAKNEQDILALPPEQIDLAKALFLSTPQSDKADLATYEALIDMMALSLQTRITPKMSDEDKINLINTYIFHELGFRFPPQSLFAKDVDIYTFLPSVLDSRKGVCLGVSLLYLCLAQRLDLPLSIVTPPGHIFVRYKKGDTLINIETTARGIHLDSSEYLNLDIKALDERTLKETIGFAHVNQASVFLQKKEYQKALQAYKRAEPYNPGDPLLKTLLGMTNILLDQKEEGERLLKEAKAKPSETEIPDHTLIDDYFEGQTNKEAIALLFLSDDKNRESILKKKNLLEEYLKTHPKCRTSLFSLATCWLKLHREKEALQVLKIYHEIDSKNITVEYYLSSLYLKRQDLPSAWNHFHQLEALCASHDHTPKALKQLNRALKTVYPE